MGRKGIIVLPAEKWRVLKGNILQCWESNERSKWSSIEKPLWKEGENLAFMLLSGFGIYFFYSDKTLLRVCFSLQIQTVYTSVILNFLMFTSSCLLKKNFVFSIFVSGSFLRQSHCLCKTYTVSHICVNANTSVFPGVEK